MNNRGPRPQFHNTGDVSIQGDYLQKIVLEVLPQVGIDEQEEAEKEAFRAIVDQVCRATITEYEKQELGNENFDSSSVEVQCFGSMRSGFATKASDMDLALLSPKSHPAPDCAESPIPRLLEKKLLELGYGARLLTKTRVPIIKLCQHPTENLLSLLREERMKWENGFVVDADHDQTDDLVDQTRTQLPESAKTTPVDDRSGVEVALPTQETPNIESADQDDPPTKDKITNKRTNLLKAIGAYNTPEENYSKNLSSLNQKEHQSLGDYYNTAKRLLRKLGSRDITPSSTDLTGNEPTILNDVCRAFLVGLHDSALLTSLRSYKSIKPLFDSSSPYLQRTLHGVWTQIDGERLALGWDYRPLQEANDRKEGDGYSAVISWRTLNDKESPGTEPLLYNRQLTASSERLKRVDSLRLMFLEQIQSEDPIYYHARAQKILENLMGHATLSREQIFKIAIDRYVLGVSNTEIRQALQEIVESLGDRFTSLRLIGTYHRAVQLAADYEHGLKTGSFDSCKKEDRDAIVKYVTILRTLRLDEVQKSTDPEVISLVTKIRRLPDPTASSANKPRDRYKDHLEFPKNGVGIQCDINFSAHLGLHNTLLLRCYSQSDARVRPMILFVKHWAKTRGINTPYRGTLSSYGYVLMVLHYLVNIATPFVCPNLQEVKRDPPPYLSPVEIEARTSCNGRDVRFWRNEMEIKDLAQRNMLNHNHETIGQLLRGFFEYYAQTGPLTGSLMRGFDWGREVLSLRTHGGILIKQEKGWVGAKTVVETTAVAAPPTPLSARHPEHPLPASDGEISPSPTTDIPPTPRFPLKTVEETKEVRHRYLFAIEDPFELDHNVARTVTHNGIVAIRDEFRRAWRFIRGAATPGDGSTLLQSYDEPTTENKSDFQTLLDLLHGKTAEGGAAA